MIVEMLVRMITGLITWMVGLFGSLPVPGWLSNNALSSLLASGAGLGAWVPWAVIGSVVATVLAALAISFGIKAVRLVISHLTGGGGSAA